MKRELRKYGQKPRPAFPRCWTSLKVDRGITEADFTEVRYSFPVLVWITPETPTAYYTFFLKRNTANAFETNVLLLSVHINMHLLVH